jgi:hypothetical protein
MSQLKGEQASKRLRERNKEKDGGSGGERQPKQGGSLRGLGVRESQLEEESAVRRAREQVMDIQRKLGTVCEGRDVWGMGISAGARSIQAGNV